MYLMTVLSYYKCLYMFVDMNREKFANVSGGVFLRTCDDNVQTKKMEAI